MSSKHPKPKDPAKKKTTRGDVINFMNYISTDENFCLRVWNTVQTVFEREAAKAKAGDGQDGTEAAPFNVHFGALNETEMAERAGRNVVTEEFEQFPEAVPA